MNNFVTKLNRQITKTLNIVTKFTSVAEMQETKEYTKLHLDYYSDKSLVKNEEKGKIKGLYLCEGEEYNRPIIFVLLDISDTKEIGRKATYNLMQLSSVGCVSSAPVQLASIELESIKFHKAYVDKDKLSALGENLEKTGEVMIITDPS